MEPVSMIVAALAAGAAAAAKDTAGTAVRDAYDGLKAVLSRRFMGNAGAEVALENYPEAPDVWVKPLEDALAKTGATDDPDVMEAARTMVAAADPEGAAQGKYSLTVSGGKVEGLVQGDGASVTMNFGKPST